MGEFPIGGNHKGKLVSYLTVKQLVGNSLPLALALRNE
jgi:hypothetical protein